MKERILSIDFMKIVCAILVICIHSGPFKPLMDTSIYFKLLAGMFDQLSRVAVPFFFIAAGFLFSSGRTVNNKNNVNRLIVIFVFWSVLY
ncbi:hypothetical protein EGH82_23485, partial [Vibrio ponticus]